MTGARAVPLPIVDAGPEALFRVGRVHADGDVVRGSMPTGPWLAGTGGSPALGSLGVLVDNVLGYAIIAARPPGHWSVSTEISLDLLGRVPDDGSSLHAAGKVLHSDGAGGFATGEVVDDAGRLIAVCRQRGRFVPSGPDPDALRFTLPQGVTDAMSLVGAVRRPTGLDLEVTEVLENPMHNLHGGIALCVADLAAGLALTDGGPPLTTASIQMTYVRGVPGGSTLAVDVEVEHRGRTLGAVEVIGRVAGRSCTIGRVTAHPAGR
ncbi:MAG: hypothetical protein JWR20_2038 [Marmoricola sp.]|nr:hypothetical protein [Marmoricola sp.]